MNKNTRRRIVFALNIIKYICMLLGLFVIVIGICIIDSREPYDKLSYLACVISLCLCLSAYFNELFVIKYLVKDYEHIYTIFNIKQSNKKSKKKSKYKSYLISSAEDRRNKQIDFNLHEINSMEDF